MNTSISVFAAVSGIAAAISLSSGSIRAIVVAMAARSAHNMEGVWCTMTVESLSMLEKSASKLLYFENTTNPS